MQTNSGRKMISNYLGMGWGREVDYTGYKESLGVIDMFIIYDCMIEMIVDQ